MSEQIAPIGAKDAPRTNALILSHIRNKANHDDWLFRLNEIIPFAKALEVELATAINERNACHKCWDDFTAKLATVAPAMKNAPLFQQAEDIVALISACESEMWQHGIGQARDTVCACRICAALNKLKGKQ